VLGTWLDTEGTPATKTIGFLSELWSQLEPVSLSKPHDIKDVLEELRTRIEMAISGEEVSVNLEV
jgi:hypothetical protein